MHIHLHFHHLCPTNPSRGGRLSLLNLTKLHPHQLLLPTWRFYAVRQLSRTLKPPNSMWRFLHKAMRAWSLQNARRRFVVISLVWDGQLLTCVFGQQLRRISSQGEHPGSALRISVESGGCHGYQYKMELVRQHAPED